MSESVLITGGAGYIGSHISLVLLEQGLDVVILDNFSNSHMEVLLRIEAVSGKRCRSFHGDIRDHRLVRRVIEQQSVSAVIHLAGLKSVGDSVQDPLEYFDNNVAGTVSLCRAMADAGIFNLIFSSSATVYGMNQVMPVHENMALGVPSNPYARSKLMIEDILRDLSKSDSRWSVGLLRYFNPIGAHPSGTMGEDPTGVPNNLLPYICRVVTGQAEMVKIFGGDYPTPDGTAIRDYIHVLDLAEGHLGALRHVMNRKGVDMWNLGTGRGCSVLELIRAFEEVSGQTIPFEVVDRRPGDLAESWANATKARDEFGWVARRNVKHMVTDTWRWLCQNPRGYVG